MRRPSVSLLCALWFVLRCPMWCRRRNRAEGATQRGREHRAILLCNDTFWYSCSSHYVIVCFIVAGAGGPTLLCFVLPCGRRDGESTDREGRGTYLQSDRREPPRVSLRERPLSALHSDGTDVSVARCAAESSLGAWRVRRWRQLRSADGTGEGGGGGYGGLHSLLIGWFRAARSLSECRGGHVQLKPGRIIGNTLIRYS